MVELYYTCTNINQLFDREFNNTLRMEIKNGIRKEKVRKMSVGNNVQGTDKNINKNFYIEKHPKFLMDNEKVQSHNWLLAESKPSVKLDEPEMSKEEEFIRQSIDIGLDHLFNSLPNSGLTTIQCYSQHGSDRSRDNRDSRKGGSSRENPRKKTKRKTFKKETKT